MAHHNGRTFFEEEGGKVSSRFNAAQRLLKRFLDPAYVMACVEPKKRHHGPLSGLILPLEVSDCWAQFWLGCFGISGGGLLVRISLSSLKLFWEKMLEMVCYQFSFKFLARAVKTNSKQ